ncbi:MAG: BBP7 family outer membrane beta-barrel protein, partial [Thermoguttaceae bacterium]
VRPYDNWAEPKTGFFCTFDGIYWYMTPPKKTTVGDPGPSQTVYVDPTDSISESNSLDTGRFRTTWKQGDRIELGYVGEHHGFLISTIELNQQTEHIAGDNVYMIFTDPPFGPTNSHYLDVNWGTLAAPNNLQAPVVFGNAAVQNIAKLSGVEAMYLYRESQLPLGGTLEWMAGGRFIEFDDTFSFTGLGGFMDTTYFNNGVKNSIAGPQIGARLYLPVGRCAFSFEGRFMAGVNTEIVRQDGQLAGNINTTFGPPPRLVASPVTAANPIVPSLMAPIGFQHSAQFTEFSPVVEVRGDFHAKLTNLITLKAGWTTLWMNGIGRGADMVDYTVSTLNGAPMGINTTNVSHANRQDLLVYGINIGLELNR